MRQFDRDQPGRVHEPPERIAGAGEVMAYRLGAQAGIDPDEQYPGRRRKDIAERHASIITPSRVTPSHMTPSGHYNIAVFVGDKLGTSFFDERRRRLLSLGADSSHASSIIAFV